MVTNEMIRLQSSTLPTQVAHTIYRPPQLFSGG